MDRASWSNGNPDLQWTVKSRDQQEWKTRRALERLGRTAEVSRVDSSTPNWPSKNNSWVVWESQQDVYPTREAARQTSDPDIAKQGTAAFDRRLGRVARAAARLWRRASHSLTCELEREWSRGVIASFVAVAVAFVVHRMPAGVVRLRLALESTIQTRGPRAKRRNTIVTRLG